MKKLIFAIFIAISCVNLSLAQRGACGDNVKWSISGETLTIYGTGDMSDYTADVRPSWFPYEANIKHVIIEPGVTSVGDFVFYKAGAIDDVQLPEGLLSIGMSAFDQCTSLKSINLPKSLCTLKGSYVSFYPNQSYGYNFASCPNLTEITIPESLTQLGYRAFFNCTKLAKVNWNAVTNETQHYHYELFFGTNVKTVNFGPEVKRVPEYLFYDINNLTEINTCGTIEAVGPEAFYNTAWLNSHITSGCVYIDHVLYTYIGNPISAFEINVPEGITGITDGAFRNQKYLVKVSIPESLRSIGAGAFKGCTSLGSVQWNAIDCETGGEGSSIFSECAIYEFLFGPKVQYIRAALLSGCNQLTEVELPASLLDVGPESFSNCTGLKSLKIPDSVTSIAWNVFGWNRNVQLDSITLGTGIKWIGSYIPAEKVIWNIKNLEWGWLESLNSPLSYGTTQEIVFGDSVEVIPDNLCTSSSSLTKITLGKSVKQIGKGAFYGTNIDEVFLHEGIENIGFDAFGNTKIKNVLIPASVKNNQGFRHNSLENIVLLGDSLLSSWEVDMASTANIYVKNYDVYGKDRWGWKRFNVIPLLSNMTVPELTYNGAPHNLAEHCHPTCNLPEYDVTLTSESGAILPGKYQGIIKASFSGVRDFDAQYFIKYVINQDEATIRTKSELSELMASVENLVEEATDRDTEWRNLVLTPEDMYSNAKCKVEGIDQFSSWSVLLDSEENDTWNFEAYGDASQFHSDYSGDDSDDGLDHYIGIKIPDNISFDKFRFDYTTRWKDPIHAPTEITVEASADGDTWDILAVIDNELPTGIRSTYTSADIPVYHNYNDIRIVVHENNTNEHYGGHAIFVMTKFDMEYTPAMTGIKSKYPNVTAELINSVQECLWQSQMALNTAHYCTEDYLQIINSLTESKNALMAAMKNTSAVTDTRISSKPTAGNT